MTSHQNIYIRVATIQDLEPVAQLFDAYRQFYEQAPDIELAKAFIADRLISQDSTILLAINSAQKIIGFCQLYPTFCSVIAAPVCVLYDLFVDSNVRKTGAGRALMLAAHEYAANNGFKRLDLTTAKTNTSAQALYESLGWVRDDLFYSYSKAL